MIRNAIYSSAPIKKTKGTIEDFSYNLIRQVSHDKRNWPFFYMQHLLMPDHTPKGYTGTPEQLDAYRSDYKAKSEVVARILKNTLAEIQESDPSAIVFVYGDHGPWTSRFAEFDDKPDFVVKDRYGTMGALINAERCLLFLTPPKGEHFQTIARTVVGLVRCLAGGTSPLTRPVDYNTILQIGADAKFEDHLYE